MGWTPLPDDRGRPPQRIDGVLDALLGGLGAPPVDVLTRIGEVWPELVGPEAAVELRPTAVEGHRLVVVASGPAWASQARWLTAGVLAEAAERWGEGVLTEVVVRVDRGPSGG